MKIAPMLSILAPIQFWLSWKPHISLKIKFVILLLSKEITSNLAHTLLFQRLCTLSSRHVCLLMCHCIQNVDFTRILLANGPHQASAHVKYVRFSGYPNYFCIGGHLLYHFTFLVVSSLLCLNTKSRSYPNSPHFQAPYSNILTHTFIAITFFLF